MSGCRGVEPMTKTRKQNVHELCDQLDAIVFEGDTVREWIVELRKRGKALRGKARRLARGDLMHADPLFEGHLLKVVDAIEAAEKSLAFLQEAAAKRDR